MTLDPQCKEAWNLIGQIYKELAQADNAIENFSKALAVDPGCVANHDARPICFGVPSPPWHRRWPWTQGAWQTMTHAQYV